MSCCLEEFRFAFKVFLQFFNTETELSDKIEGIKGKQGATKIFHVNTKRADVII